MFSDGKDDFLKYEKTMKMTREVAGLQIVANDNNVEKISQLLLQNRHISLRMLADEVNIGKDTVRKIVVEDLRKRKICSRFVPQSSTAEQEDRRIADWRDLVATVDIDLDFFRKTVTGHETRRFACDQTAKCQSSAWVGETLPRPKNLRFQKSRVKIMLLIFFRLARRNAQRICSGG